jgi:hypothetical protein
MTVYGITVDYDYTVTHKREFIRVWSPPFFSVFEADGYTLPKGDGYMLTTYNGDKVRVSCPTPRNDANWMAVDQAISDALNAHHAARGDGTVSEFGSRIDADIDARDRNEAAAALAALQAVDARKTLEES